MTSGLYVEFVVPKDDPDWDPDLEHYGDTGCEIKWVTYPEGDYVHVRYNVEWLEHDGAGGIYAHLVGAAEDLYLSDDSLPVWKAVAE